MNDWITKPIHVPFSIGATIAYVVPSSAPVR